VKCHVAFVAFAKILLGVLRPLIGLREQEAIRIIRIEGRTDLLQDLVGLGEVLVVRALALDQV
jgi:hypothetical protein